ncbi:hypothetical protein [Streptomyces sp. 1222.5]|uniref:hypothetical protein n=1 Tax=Streptomyces sp. 1222.5 TaxID=1881026 RepID=UPI003D75E1B1
MSPLRTPQFEGRVEPDGQLRCMARTWAWDPPCTQLATWHVAWLLAPRGRFALVCDAHMVGSAEQYDYVDRHPADLTCAMPGVGWFTLPGQPSHCVLVAGEQIGQEGQK